ncbi:MAG: CCA tRNA nucleotidyltransferase [Bdellovibrionaceae bacterium]|nr:CCA tRNA nucleotidyltransferase [Pseudobdellovibrionaceae bacterium]
MLHEDWIDPSARRIVHILQTAGYESFLVGGCVRDLLAGIHPKDFDIATNALPNEVKRKVPGSYVIGKRFRLVLVKRGEQQFEVATFRRNITAEESANEDNPVVGDNYFGTVEEDALRRDFTINALFYDPINNSLIDYVEGKKDISCRTIRMIGDPKERFIEDPIRILRALRLSHKLNFSLEPSLRRAMTETAAELLKSALPRRREEYLKILRLKEPGRAWAELFDLGILHQTVPALDELYSNPDESLLFENLLLEIPRIGIDLGSPLELFAGFLYAFMKARDPEAANEPSTIESSPRWNAFMKDELGMFKVEMAVFVKCLELIPALSRISSYEKKGQRRKLGFLRNDSLPLALKLSQMDGAIGPQEFMFWINEIRKNSEEMWNTRPEPDLD